MESFVVRRVMRIEHAIQQKAGPVVFGHVPRADREWLRVGASVAVRRADGASIRTTVEGIEFPRHLTPDGRLDADYVGLLLPGHIGIAALPIGSELWLATR